MAVRKHNTHVNLNFREYMLHLVINAMMSAEPGRKAPYSKDIVWRVVRQRIAMELPFRKMVRNLNLSLDTVHNIYK